MEPVVLDGATLSADAVHRVAAGAPVSLHQQAVARMDTSAHDAPVLREKWTWLSGAEAPEADAEVIAAFVLGHCAAAGDWLPSGVVRAIVACRINVLARGHSGVRPTVAQRLLDLVNAGVLPRVRRQGSLGVGGCPQLSAILAAYLGLEGELDTPTGPIAATDLPDRLVVNQREALALMNGSTTTTAMGALAVARARRVLDVAMQAAAMTFEVARADTHCLDDRALRARGHAGGVRVAAALRSALAGSAFVSAGRKPDPFSIRCTPAVLGAALDAVDQVEAVLTTELNGSIDNPLRFGVDDVDDVDAGNFHAAPVALALDHLKIAMTHVASISERRIFRITYGQLSGLPSYLVKSTGLNSGLMLAQYTAASRLSECKGLAHPASVDSIPTIQHSEDHVSMGPIAAFTALELIEAVADVVAIELVCAAQGMDLQGERVAGSFGDGTTRCRRAVRAVVDHWADDRVLHPDLMAAGQLVRAGLDGGPAW